MKYSDFEKAVADSPYAPRNKETLREKIKKKILNFIIKYF